MKTTHKIFFKDSKKMGAIPSSSVHLVVTSPPYPMIEMWDDMFKRQNTEIATVGGLLSESLGRIPVTGDTLEWRGHRLTVLSAGSRGAELVTIVRID